MSFGKNISALSLAQGVTAVANFVSAVLLARLLMPSGQGQWSLYVSAYAFGIIAFGFGLPQALVHFISAKKIKKDNVLSNAFFISLISTLLFGVVLLFVSFFDKEYVFLPNIQPAYLIILGLVFHFFLLNCIQLMIAMLHAEKSFILAASYTALPAIALLLLYCFLYVFSNKGLEENITYLVVGNVIILVGQFGLLLNKLLKAYGYNFKLSTIQLYFFKPLIVFAFLVFITNFIQFLNYKMDLWFINGMVKDKDELGIYSIAVSLGQLLWLIPNAFHAVLFTEVSSNLKLGLKDKIWRWSKWIFLGSLILAIVGYLLSFYLVPLLFGKDYTGIIGVFPYLLPGIVIFAATILISAYFAGINRVGINLNSGLIGFAFSILLNIVLIPSFGIIGAAIATSISYFCSAIYLLYVFKKTE